MNVYSKFLSILFVLIINTQIFSQQIIYVNQNASGANNGTSWANAYTDLQDALSSANAEDTIWVAAGTYKPTAGTYRGYSFNLVKHVPVFGGFAGNETSLTQRDYENNQTILSGDIGIANNNSDNSYTVVTAADSTIIDGFTIRDGFDNGGSLQGGGIEANNRGKNLIIRNCTFTRNFAKDYGSALFNNNDNVLVENCKFIDNDIVDNSSYVNYGGAIYTQYGDIVVKNCYFENNSAKTKGGAADIEYSIAVFDNCTFVYNRVSDGDGGAVYNYGSGNYCKFTNTVFHLNFANNGSGAAIYAAYPDSVINCTFDNNQAGNHGDDFADDFSPSFIINSVFNSVEAYYNINGSTHNISYSIFQSQYAEINGNGDYLSGTGIIFQPQIHFVDVNNNDFRLAPGSGGIDAGNANYAPAVDKDGNSRYDDFFKENTGTGTPNYTDMGAYECQQNSPMHGVFEIGTSAPVFHTFNQAVDSMLAVGIDGDVTFNVQNGTYNEQVAIPKINGADNNSITFQSASGDSTDVRLTFSPSSGSNNYILKLDSIKNISFKSICFQAQNTNYSGIVNLGVDLKNISFENNYFKGINNDIIHKSDYSPDSNIVITNNRFENGYNALYLRFKDFNINIENNEFVNQSNTALLLEEAKQNIIRNNFIYSENNINAIYLLNFSNSTGDSISNNKIYLKSEGSGIYIIGGYSSDTILVYNNYIYLNSNDPNSYYPYGIYASSFNIPIKIIHNTISVTGSNTNSRCMDFSNQNFTFNANNIYTNYAGGQTVNFDYIPQYSDYNNYYSTGNFLINSKNLSDWQFYFTKDLHSFSYNPYFENDTSYVTHTITINNKGTALGITTDIDGNPRNTSLPDIGAYEFDVNLSPMHGTYTIGGTASDYATINNAVDALNIRGIDGAVTFEIATGEYNEQISIPEIVGASAANTITFKSANNDSTSVLVRYKPLNYLSNNYQYNYNKIYTWQLNSADYITIKGISLTTDTSFGVPLDIRNSANYNTIANNKIYVPNSSSNLVYNLNSTNDSNNVFKNNYFENGNISLYFGNRASNAGYSKDILIENNIFNNPKSAISATVKNLTLTNNYTTVDTSGYGNIFDINGTCKISENIFNINGNASSGYKSIIYCHEATITNNMISINGNCSAIQTLDSANIYNNSIRINGDAYALSILGNTNVKNNAFVAYRNNAIIKIYDTTNCDIDYNAYYNTYSVLITAGNNYNFSDWQQSTGFDTHSIFHEVEYLSDTDLHTNDPWLNNAGTPIASVTTDIDGETRNSANPDIGADEFSGLAPLSGVYTVGTTGYFSNLSQVEDSLNICGVKDSVIFKIQSGTYTEQFTLADSNITRIPDTSAIVFESLSGDSTSVILQYQANATNNYIINLDSASYVSIKNLTLQALDSTYSTVIKSHSSNHINIKNNVLIGAGNTSPVIYSPDGVDENISITNNLIKNGKQGIIWVGEQNNNEKNNIIANNVLSNQYSGGIFVKYQTSNNILANKIYHTNIVEDTTWIGIASYNCSGYSWNNTGNYIANNMISCNAANKTVGIHNYQSSENIFYNSVNIYGSNATESRAFNYEEGSIQIRNNIFYNNAGGLVYYVTNFPDLDYNDIYTNGDNFAYKAGFITDFTAWKNTSGKDQNSIDVVPAFVSNSDLHINGNLLLKAGAPLSVITDDIDGETRDTAISFIGADEIVVNCQGALAGNYEIGTTGDFTSIADAVLAMYSCGIADTTTFYIQTGTYNENIVINGDGINYINGIKPVTFTSLTNDYNDVILQNNTDSINNYLFKLQNTKNISITHITLINLDSLFGNAVYITGNSDSCYIANCHIINTYYGGDDNNKINFNGIYINGSDVVDSTYFYSLKNNKIEGGNNAMFVEYNEGFTIEFENDTIINTKLYGVYVYTCKYLNINNCVIDIDSIMYDAVKLWGLKQAGNISNNRINIKNSENGSAINVGYIENDLVVYNNFINTYNTKALTISRNTMIYNNTIVNHSGYNVTVNIANNTCEFINNCVVDKNTAESSIHINNNNNLVRNNNIYIQNFDIESFDTQLGGNTNTISFMPDFASETDLHTNSVLLYQTGLYLPEVLSDIDGETRNNPPCIGADEFTNPVFNLHDTVFCYFDETFHSQNPFTYDIGSGFDSYQWSNGSDSSSILIDTGYANPGENIYTVTVTLGANTYTDSVNIVLGKPTVFNYQEHCIKLGGELTLIAAENSQYLWSTGDTTQTTTVIGNPPVYLTVTDNYGCKARDVSTNSDSIKVYVSHNYADIQVLANNEFDYFPAPSDTVICENTSFYIMANPQEDYNRSAFLWSTGDTTSRILIDTSHFSFGTHIITLTVTERKAPFVCETYDTLVVKIKDCAGVDEIANNKNIAIYPNPAKTRINVLGDYTINKYEIIELGGRAVMFDKPNNKSFVVDVSGLPKGVYFIRLYYDNNMTVKKLIIDK